jgi:hypothetical protein
VSCSRHWRTSAAATPAKSKRHSARACPICGHRPTGSSSCRAQNPGWNNWIPRSIASRWPRRKSKSMLIEACVQVVGADGVIQEREAELLRAIAETLDCPIPPFVRIAKGYQEDLYVHESQK